MSAGLWFFFWPPPDWPAGVPPEPPPVEEPRRGAGGGHRKYQLLDDSYWQVRERFLRLALRSPDRPPATAPVRAAPPPKLVALVAKRAAVIEEAQLVRSRADFQRLSRRVAALTSEIARIERERDDEDVLSAILPFLNVF